MALNDSWRAMCSNLIKKIVCLSGPHLNSLVETQTLGNMMQSYTLLVTMDQWVLMKFSKESDITSHEWSMTHRVLECRRSKMIVIYEIMKIMFPLDYDYSVFVTTQVLECLSSSPELLKICDTLFKNSFRILSVSKTKILFKNE